MEQYEPDRLSSARLAAMRRSLRQRQGLPHPPFAAARVRRRRVRAGRARDAERLRDPRGEEHRGRLVRGPLGQGEADQLLQLDRVHGRRRQRETPPHARRVRQTHRDQGQVHRGHQRQRRVLREAQAAARGGPGHRTRPHMRHRLAGRPAHPLRLGAEAGRVQPAARVRQSLPAVPYARLGPGTRVLVPLDRYLHGHRLQQEGAGRGGGEVPLRHARQPRDSRDASAFCRRCGTAWA